MKSKKAWTLLSLMVLGMCVALNASGQPPIPAATARPIQPAAMLNGSAQVQTEAPFVPAEMLTKVKGTNTLMVPLEPQFTLGTNTLVTGFVVDCLAPELTWKMLNPPATAKDFPKLTVSSPPPVVAPHAFNGNLAEHQADFALLRFSLGSSPKAIKPQP